LRADTRGRAAYAAMIADAAFRAPRSYGDLRVEDFDALVLPGGHYARGMRAYLESETLQAFVGAFFASEKPVAAICHGVVLAARSQPPDTGRSSLYGKKTTALTWSQESLAERIGRFSRFWEPDYYRTYAEKSGEARGFRGVQAEVTRALADPSDFRDVPKTDPDYRLKTDGTKRDSPTDARPAWVVRDGTYVSARWPGDAFTFAKTFATVLRERAASAKVIGTIR
jgi:putative intracellular protease/amidase